MNFEQINQSEDLSIDKAFKNKAFSLLHQTEIKGEKDDIWEKIIIANELKLSGANVEKELSSGEEQDMSEELANLREKLKNSTDPLDYIDLARCVYRFKNLNIPLEKLNANEKEGVLNLPNIFRDSPELCGHLAYLPQIASALDTDLEEIKKSQDGLLLRQAIETRFAAENDRIKKFNSLALSGLLVDLDATEFKRFIEGNNWNQEDWHKTVNYLIDLKNSPKREDTYTFLRLINPARKVLNFLEKNK